AFLQRATHSRWFSGLRCKAHHTHHRCNEMQRNLCGRSASKSGMPFRILPVRRACRERKKRVVKGQRWKNMARIKPGCPLCLVDREASSLEEAIGSSSGWRCGLPCGEGRNRRGCCTFAWSLKTRQTEVGAIF